MVDNTQNPISGYDFREQMEYGIAYRIAEMYEVRPSVARLWVRDVMKYGPNSPHFKKVAKGLVEIFQPLIAPFLPLVPQVVRALVESIQATNQRGWDAEQHTEHDVKG